MARKPSNPAAAKAAKQKKLAIALAGVLVLALAYAFHTIQGMNKSGRPEPVAATVSTNTTATTTTTSTPATPAATTPAAPATTPTASTAPTVLVSAARPAAASGQLQSFSRFESKDPFATSGPKTAAAAPSSPSSAPASTRAPKSTPTPQKPAASFTTPPPTSAVLAVNGEAATVTVDADFPVSTDPTQNALFHLVALTAKTATVSVVGGSYASGAPTLKLQVNRPVTLVNTADGKRYTLELFPQGTPPPAAAPAASATTTAPAAP